MTKLETLLACIPPSDFKNRFVEEIESLRQQHDRDVATLKSWNKAITELQQQLAECQKDMKVYRWLLDGGINSLPYEDYGLGPVFDLSAEAIKVAMQRGE